ncbi:MAG: hypothetical protein NWE76_08320 [Candidatus Bathyarchaeota archaeon]|nr:hypothetical protein [Candidatus Bathyarchaeota archaeon]
MMSPKISHDDFARDIEEWFGRRCRKLDKTAPGKDMEQELKEVFRELEEKLREAQEDPELPSMKVGMTSVAMDDDTGEPTHLLFILEKGVSINWKVPDAAYGTYKIEYSPKNPANRWKEIGKVKDAKQVSPYPEEHKQEDRKHSRFNKFVKHMPKKLPVEE